MLEMMFDSDIYAMNAKTRDFVDSLRASFERYGNLSEEQFSCLRHMVRREEHRTKPYAPRRPRAAA
jgi:tRNA C32,U32 (ribose-2'-O)-methylase TrmJ